MQRRYVRQPKADSRDTKKSRSAIGFDDAALIFEGEVIEWPDTRTNYGEVRVDVIGEANGKIPTQA